MIVDDGQKSVETREFPTSDKRWLLRAGLSKSPILPVRSASENSTGPQCLLGIDCGKHLLIATLSFSEASRAIALHQNFSVRMISGLQ